MARGRFIFDKETQTLVPAAEYYAKKAAAAPDRRSSLSTPMVIGAMPETRSPINGRMYTDKSSYYRHVERAGCAIVGFDKNWESQVTTPRYDAVRHEADVVADVKKSIEQLNSGTAEPIHAR